MVINLPSLSVCFLFPLRYFELEEVPLKGRPLNLLKLIFILDHVSNSPFLVRAYCLTAFGS